jgi:hypothetical protein
VLVDWSTAVERGDELCCRKVDIVVSEVDCRCHAVKLCVFAWVHEDSAVGHLDVVEVPVAGRIVVVCVCVWWAQRRCMCMCVCVCVCV